MKIRLLNFIFLCFSFSSYAQYTAIPDTNFEAALSAYDDVASDGQVPTANISSLTTLDVSNSNISDLAGIEDFVALETLDISNNTSISEVDITKNTQLITLDASSTGIDLIDLSKNIALENFSADNTPLIYLDFETNSELKTVSITNNTSLVTLDFELNRKLTSLNFNTGDIRYIKIDNSFNTNITFLDIRNQPNLLCVQVDSGASGGGLSGWLEDNFNLYSTDCGGTYVPDDNFEQALIDLGIDTSGLDNFVNTRDINLAALTTLNLENKNITDATGIEAFTTVRNLNLGSNNLSAINLYTLIELTDLELQGNSIKALNLSKNTKLEVLNINGNRMESIDITANTNLIELRAPINNFETIDLSNNIRLEFINLNRNQLLSLDVSNNSVLTSLSLNRNSLRSLNIANGNNSNFTTFTVHTNPNLLCITVDDSATANLGTGNYASWVKDATAIYSDDCSLLTYVPDDNFEQALIDAGYDTTGLDNFVPTANIASVERFSGGTGGELYNKGITDLTGIEDFVSLIQLSSTGNPLTSINLSGNTALEILSLGGTQLTNLDLSANTKLLTVNVRDNQLSSIDLSANNVLTSLSISDSPLMSIALNGNTNLERLSLNNTQLASVDISSNSALISLSIVDTPLTSLDVSANTALKSIECTNNQLTSLDISANTLLEDLYLTDNQFTNLDVGANTRLEELYFENNQLTSLDLSANTALEYLYCNDNRLTALDLTANPAMEELEANNNQLAYLNVKNGNNATTFSYLSVENNPSLNCIEVDDAAAANAGTGNYSGWSKDAAVSYNEICTDCAVDGVTIASQSELDAFIAQLGTCNTVNGNLTIRNANDVTDLSGLAGIETINGKLVIGDNELLPNLNGLQNLKTITNGFSIFRNDIFTDITALSGIVDPIKDFSISDNPLLTDITAVLGLTVTELLRVDRQTLTHALIFPNVTTLTGDNTFNSAGPGSLSFSNLTTPSINIPNLIRVENFFTLRNIDASTVSFPMLISTGRSFIVDNVNSTTFNFDVVQSLGSFILAGTQLVDLSPFSTVTSLGTSISIGNNLNLNDLSALNNVSAVTGVFLNVTNNSALMSLDGLGFISGETGLIVIENNPELLQIDALQSITSTGYFRIKNNEKLNNIDGLQNLTETTETDMGEFLQSTVSGNTISSVNLTSLRTVANQLNIVESGITNFCGLYPYVTNGNGQTTLNLTGSTFTIADILDCEDVFSCPFYDLPVDNFNIEAINETCSDKNNGMISITAIESLSYIATVGGNDYNFTSTLEVPDLAPGSYTLCIAIDGIADCEQCFDINIQGAEKLAGKTTVSSKELFVEVETGTAPYTVMVNGSASGKYISNSFAVSVDHGDEVEVVSSLDCEGKLSTKVSLFDKVTLSPNPTQGDVILSLGTTGVNKVGVVIYNSLGVQISSKEYDVSGSEVTLATQELSSGIYFVRIEGLESTTFKLVKQ
ncbi:leucine-rich repeat domain-containing protein [Aquimarina mytili]|uniref:T9SS type A sorting domain-containing protein n=1 Tax=Aquimarina mytili TaxID=874423 RepID=A0A936ZTC6_9FLAO|nr:leucine-rich repeat domain-containing protein [Aquimarina mytili]MBL0683932.1 T9SS type A sorting domain-containing protein [Aquimarina mytili]